MSDASNKPVPYKKSATLGVKLGCGAIAGVIGTSIIFPLDMVKTRLQNQQPNKIAGKLPYNGM
jgi:solute carrier family 25 aspartate/glutamate transporter 12/13